MKRYFLAAIFLTIGIVLSVTEESEAWYIAFMAICYIGSLAVFLLSWIESVSLKHSTGTLSISKYLCCKRVRHIEFKFGDISVEAITKECKFLYYFTVITASHNVKFLRTMIPRQFYTYRLLINHFMKPREKTEEEKLREAEELDKNWKDEEPID